MTADTTAPIADIRIVVFWAESLNNMGDKVLQPVRNEIQVKRLGYDEWEKIELVNVVPDHVMKAQQEAAEAAQQAPENPAA